MITDQFRAAIQREIDAGTKIPTISAETGFSQPCIRKFLSGETSGSGSLFDALAARYKLTLRKRGNRGK